MASSPPSLCLILYELWAAGGSREREVKPQCLPRRSHCVGQLALGARAGCSFWAFRAPDLAYLAVVLFEFRDGKLVPGPGRIWLQFGRPFLFPHRQLPPWWKEGFGSPGDGRAWTFRKEGTFQTILPVHRITCDSRRILLCRYVVHQPSQ